MNYEEYKNKYGSKEVSDYEIYDAYGNLITKINTVYSEELNITKKGRYFLRITDALIDKVFLDYLNKNGKFEGFIKAKTLFISMNDQDSNVLIDIPKVKLSNYKFKSICGEVSKVNILFELFNSDKGYAIDYQIQENV